MKYTILALLIFSLASCMKNHSCISEPDVKSSNAKVYYTGPVTSDGCGWVIEVNSTTYSPTYELAAEFQVNELPVSISYKLPNNSYYSCFKSATGIPQIQILSIKK